eukprot:3077286-Pleurochrysis_carterae.AAC.4
MGPPSHNQARTYVRSLTMNRGGLRWRRHPSRHHRTDGKGGPDPKTYQCGADPTSTRAAHCGS